MPDPVLLIALRSGLPEHTTEAEPVTVEVDGESVVIVLDDGETLTFDKTELLKAAA